MIVQAAVPVLQSDDARALGARVLAAEHQIYPRAVRWFAEQRLQIDGGRVRVEGSVADTDLLMAPVLDETYE